MEQQTGTAATTQAATPEQAPGWLTRQLGDFRTWRTTITAHPLKGAVFAIALFVLGVLGNEAADRVMQNFREPDDFLVQMKDEQKQNFDALRNSLSELKGSLDGSGNAALRNVASAAEALKNTNARLIEEFTLAKRENDTLRQAVRDATGMEGGSDFIVGENSAWQIDPETSIGLDGVAASYVAINLTSRDSDTSVRKTLNPGEAIAYTSASGQACKIALHTINNAQPGSASFSRICRAGA
ncbi:hypothetical protein [Luteimonas mephitis]|uniref:hypothetical protein n=1 Tax=Luteimonas mephitis TaxID=83615 RepID=UPI00040E5773|nr:hypothetical protein [Luteimonas mephitis]